MAMLMSAQELLQRSVEGQRDFSEAQLGSANLSGMDLSYVDLTDADLGGANLIGVDLSEANLTGADLTGADLSSPNLNDKNGSLVTNLSGARLCWAILSGANLSRANLTDANLSRADLVGSNLAGANFTRADLSGADLADANLAGANLAGADLSDAEAGSDDCTSADLSRANLRGANLAGADLTGAILSGADLTNANLSGAALPFADLAGRNLQGANLTRANLSGADMRGANLADANLADANLTGADLSEANSSSDDMNCTNLRGANLSGADLTGANLSNANLVAAILTGADASEAISEAEDMDPRTDLSRAKLGGADLAGADLRGANLSSANLSAADLRWTNLARANLSGANLSDVDLSEADLAYANLNAARLSRANLNWVDLSGASLREADLTDANLASADLTGADLSSADLSGARLPHLAPSGLNLSGANLTRANLSGTNLTETNLADANLTGADLSEANLSGVCLVGVILTDANLTNANLAGTDLGGALGLAGLGRSDLGEATTSPNPKPSGVAPSPRSEADSTGDKNAKSGVEAQAAPGRMPGEAKRLISCTEHDIDMWKPAGVLERANEGEAEAQFEVGQMYDLGRGTRQDSAQAVAWYRKAAAQGHEDAKKSLGLMPKSGGQSTGNESAWIDGLVQRASEEGIPRPRYADFFLTKEEAEHLEAEFKKASSTGIVQDFLAFTVSLFTSQKEPPPRPDPRVKQLQPAVTDWELQREKLRHLLMGRRDDELRTEEDYWFRLDGREFEKQVACLLSSLGRSVRSVGGSGDGGIDLFIDKIPAQCKQHQRPQGPKVVRELLGACVAHGASTGILIVSSGLTSNAHAVARGQNIVVWTVSDLVEMSRTRDNRVAPDAKVLAALGESHLYKELSRTGSVNGFRERHPEYSEPPNAGYLAGYLEHVAADYRSIGKPALAERFLQRARQIRERPELTNRWLATGSTKQAT